MEYKPTSPGPRHDIPLLEMFTVLLWDDRQLWVLPLWWNIHTGDMEYMHALPYFEPDKRKMISLHSQHGLLVRCQWVKMPWRMVDQQTESTSSRQTGKNRGLTTPMSSGSRTERSCWNSEINTAYRHQIITKNTSLSVFLSWVKLVSCPTRLSTSREQRK